MNKQEVELTYEGGWKSLLDIQYSAKFANYLRFIEVILSAMILWRIW